VEPITEKCTPSFPLHDFIPGACNTSTQQPLYPRALCRTEFEEAINDALRQTPGCTPTVTFQDDSLCVVDEQGRYCDLDQRHNNISDQLAHACRNTDICDSTCIETLNDIVSTAGCCLMSKFNTTEAGGYDMLSYNFWQRCGLTSPGFCELRFDVSPNRVTSSGTEASISFAAALVLMILHY
jgi:hypothetical protein